MNEEYEIKKRLGNGNQNPFRVPENYFENFTARIMSQLPTDESETSSDEHSDSCIVVEMDNHKQRNKWVTWCSAIAAVAIGVVCGLYISDTQQNTNTPTHTSSYLTSQNTFEEDYYEIEEYAMIDQGDVYAYLSGF